MIESGTEFRARHWRLISVCELGMFFDDALDGSKVKVLNRIV